MFANKSPVANEQGRLYNIDTGIAGDKVFPQSTQKCQKIEDAFLDAIYPRDCLENHVVFCCLKFREVTIYFVKEKVPKTAQQDVKAF